MSKTKKGSKENPLTDEQIQFICDNYRTLSHSKMAGILGLKCAWKVTEYCKANGLKRESKTLSEADKTFIRNNYQSMKELDMCKVLGLKNRLLLQLFKREEGLARYASNRAKKSQTGSGFFNVDKMKWVA